MTSEREQLEQAIAALEAQRALLGDMVVEAALAPMRQKLASLAEPAAERRLVTILFADLVGFTSLAESVDAEVARDLMNDLFDALVPSIERYEGTVDKFIGDEIMALFGAPVAHENDPERALRAALEMQAELAAFNRRRGTAIGMHFGVNTGLVIAGAVGSRSRQEYSVLGDAVNLAARLTSAAGPGEVFVGPDTRRLTAALFDFEPLPPLALKGKQEALAAFRLRGLRQAPESPRGLRAMAAPMVGRDDELGRFRAALAALRDGQGGRLLILGEAGLGKSRLVAEARSAAPAAIAWAEGRALAHTGGMSYWVARDLLRRLLGAAAGQQPEEVGALLRERLLALAPDQAEALYPPLARLLDVPLPAAQAADDSAGQIRAAFIALLAAWSARQPLALIWEDLHWADPSSLQLLDAVLELAAAAPVLVIGVSRPDPDRRHPATWEVGRLELAPLKEQESADLIRHLLRIDRLPAPVRALMLAKAEGNPFFLEELIRSLMDAGVIVRQGDQFVATGAVESLALPDTLQGIIMARIDRLPPAARTVLQTAAVLGRSFDRRVLARLVAGRTLDDRQVDAALETLLDHAFIRLPQAAPAESGYIFKHIIIQETAYQGLLLQQRRALHLQAGEAFEALFSDRLDELDATLAYHFSAAGEWRKAARYLRQAGQHARALGALDESVGFYRSALALLKQHDDHEAAARVALSLGQAYQAALDDERARAAYQEGFALWAAASASQPALPPSPHPLRLLGGEPDQIDPALVDNLWSVMLASNLFRNLVSLTPDGGIEPDIAHSWEILDGGTRYVFSLSDTAFWSDGAPLTAHDVAYAWRRLLDPAFASPLALLLYDIRGARLFHQGQPGVAPGFRTLDDHTLEVELEQPTSHFLSILTTPATFPVPRHIVERHGVGWARQHLVTSGPFVVAEWVSDQRIVLTRNPHYHGRFGGNIQQVEYQVRPLSHSLLSEIIALYEADRLDTISLTNLAAPDELERLRQRYRADYVSRPRPFTTIAHLDVAQPPLDDTRVRQALALAIDKDALVEQALNGWQTPAWGGFVPPSMPGHAPGISLPYDPERARALLAESGYPGGAGFPVLEGMLGANRSLIGEYLAAQWRRVLGIEVRWEVVVSSRFFIHVHERQPHIFLMSWTADYHDPDNFLRVALSQRSPWRHPRYTGLIEEARRTIDQERRLALFQQADQLLMQHVPIIPLHYSRSHDLIKPWLLTGDYPWKNWTILPHDDG